MEVYVPHSVLVEPPHHSHQKWMLESSSDHSRCNQLQQGRRSVGLILHGQETWLSFSQFERKTPSGTQQHSSSALDTRPAHTATCCRQLYSESRGGRIHEEVLRHQQQVLQQM